MGERIRLPRFARRRAARRARAWGRTARAERRVGASRSGELGQGADAIERVVGGVGRERGGGARQAFEPARVERLRERGGVEGGYGGVFAFGDLFAHSNAEAREQEGGAYCGRAA